MGNLPAFVYVARQQGLSLRAALELWRLAGRKVRTATFLEAWAQAGTVAERDRG